MPTYSWNFRVILLYREALWNGLVVTLNLTAWTIVLGTLLGIVLAALSVYGNKTVRFATTAFIELFRSIPLLVLLIWLYYCLPLVAGVRAGVFITAVTALSLNLSAFAAETLRAGIEAVPRGHVEAARALGLRSLQTFRTIVLPQAARQMLPALVGLYITMLKLTSLASVIAVSELLHTANNIIAKSFRPLEVYTVLASIYAMVVIPLSLMSRRMETKRAFRTAEAERPS